MHAPNAPSLGLRLHLRASLATHPAVIRPDETRPGMPCPTKQTQVSVGLDVKAVTEAWNAISAKHAALAACLVSADAEKAKVGAKRVGCCLLLGKMGGWGVRGQGTHPWWLRLCVPGLAEAPAWPMLPACHIPDVPRMALAPTSAAPASSLSLGAGVHRCARCLAGQAQGQ